MLIRKAQMMEPTGGIQGTLHNWSLPPIIDRSHFCNIGPGAWVTKLRSLISPQAKISIWQKYPSKSLMAFVLDRCHCSWAAATAVKYKCGIPLLTLGFNVLKNQENDGTEEINSVTPTQIKQYIRHTIYTPDILINYGRRVGLFLHEHSKCRDISQYMVDLFERRHVIHEYYHRKPEELHYKII